MNRHPPSPASVSAFSDAFVGGIVSTSACSGSPGLKTGFEPQLPLG